MAKSSAIASAIKAAIEAVDLSAYEQGTGETHLRQALTLESDGPGYVTPHLVYFLFTESIEYLDRGRGVVLAITRFSLFVVFRLRPNIEDQWADFDAATDASEEIRTAITADLGGAACKVERIEYSGTQSDGATLGVQFSINAVHHSEP